MAVTSDDSQPATKERLLNTFYYKRTIKRIVVFTSVLVLGVTFPIASYFLATEIFDTRERAAGGNTLVVCVTGSTEAGCDTTTYFDADGIQQAVADAVDGDVIRITAGTYIPTDSSSFQTTYGGSTYFLETFVDLGDKEIAIEGVGNPGDVFISGDDSLQMNAFSKTSTSPVTISNLKISGFVSNYDTNHNCPEATPCSLGAPIFLGTGSVALVKNCTLTSSYITGVDHTYSAGIIIAGQNIEVSVEGNTFIDGQAGLATSIESGTVSIKENSFEYQTDPTFKTFALVDYLDPALSSSAHISFTGNTISGYSSMDLYPDHSGGIMLRGKSNVDIIGNLIFDNDYSLVVLGQSEVQVRNNIIHSTVCEAFNIEDATTVSIVNNTFTGNGDTCGRLGGISIYRNADVEIYNNIIANNLERGIYEETSGDAIHTGTLTVDYNDVWNNTNGDYVPSDIAGTNDISTDPLFVDSTNDDYHLGTSSPCIDTGIDDAGSSIPYASGTTDPDGSPIDMGAYGGPDACILDSKLSGCPDAPRDCSECVWGEICDPGTNTCVDNPDCNLTQFITCTEDADCEKIDADHCGCDYGGDEISVHVDYSDENEPISYPSCIYIPDPPDAGCTTEYKCTNRIPICKLGRCALSIEETSDADIDGDGDVDMTDYYWFVEDYLYYKEGNGIMDRSDLNGDEEMTMADYSLFVQAYLDARGL